MDGSAFRNLDFGWLKWLFVLAAIGVLALLVGLVLAIGWLYSHVTITIA